MIMRVYDIETNDLNPVTGRILEYGVITINEKLEVIDSYTGYCWRDEWNIGATDIHGLTPEFMKSHCKDLKQSVAALYAMLHQSYAIGKNNKKFDDRYVGYFLLNQLGFETIPFQFAGTLDLQTSMAPWFKQYMLDTTGKVEGRPGTLGEYQKVIGISDKEMLSFYNTLRKEPDRDRLHSALYDAALTFKCLEWLVKEKRTSFNFS